MKKIVKRRKYFRINNPLAFGILCAMILLALAGGAYALASGVIAPAVRTRQLMNATPTPTAEPTPEPQDESDDITIELTPVPEDTIVGTDEPTEPEDEDTPDSDTEETPEPEEHHLPEDTAGTKKLAGHVIGIDPARGYSSKVKGAATGIYANRLNFSVASIVKEKLESEGAKVVMGLSDVKSNRASSERADIMNKAEVELAVRLECNFTDDHTRGAVIWVPAEHSLRSDCETLGKAVLDAYIDETGLSIAKYEGKELRRKDDDFLKATASPVCTLIMGYISNPTEDALLNDADFQARMAEGVVKGILTYLGVK